ncbi:hypothetical protein D3C80_1631940 [compost metagenome]
MGCGLDRSGSGRPISFEPRGRVADLDGHPAGRQADSRGAAYRRAVHVGRQRPGSDPERDNGTNQRRVGVEPATADHAVDLGGDDCICTASQHDAQPAQWRGERLGSGQGSDHCQWHPPCGRVWPEHRQLERRGAIDVCDPGRQVCDSQPYWRCSFKPVCGGRQPDVHQ